MKVFASVRMTVLAVLIASILMSCASAPYTQKEDNVVKLVELINKGQVNKIEGLSRVPFALDSETLYLENDVSTFWDNLANAGFTMTNVKFVSTKQVTADTYKSFADTFDMKNFFARYTDKDTSMVTVTTEEGSYYLLLERAVRGYPGIRGFKGPVQ